MLLSPDEPLSLSFRFPIRKFVHATRHLSFRAVFVNLRTGEVIEIAKTGSLCCVAARPHGSNGASGEWSVGPHELYWRNNTSFSPPPPRWEFSFTSDDPSFDSNDDSVIYRSSASSNNGESRWLRGNHYYLTSDGVGTILSTPSDRSVGPQWTPPAVQEISIESYETAARRGRTRGRPPSTPIMEGTFSGNQLAPGISASHSESSDSDSAFPSCLASHRNFAARRPFFSKPVHPLLFHGQVPAESSDGLVRSGSPTLQRESRRWSSSSSGDVLEVSDAYESVSPSEGFKCGVCGRFLSPWNSSGEILVSGVLSCSHVFHVECLDQITPKVWQSDPPCPVCSRSEDDDTSDQQNLFKQKKLRTFGDEGPSRPWGCIQVGDCVDGALYGSPRNAMVVLSRNRLKRNLSLKGNSGIDVSARRGRNAPYSQIMAGKSLDGYTKAVAGSNVRG